MIDRLVLGTVQLGMPYGVGNQTGKPDFDSACGIIKTAFDQGISRFDTAQAYGDSEEVLGRAFGILGLKTKVKVYTKLGPGIDRDDLVSIRRSIESSLQKLKIDRLEGLMLHDENELLSWEKGLGKALEKLVIEGKVKSVGASFYASQKALNALDIQGIDFIQVPANILDQRFENAGVFQKARACKKEIFVRSIFLQGLLLMPLTQVPERMAYALPYLQRLERLASEMKLSRRELALGYAAQKWPGAFILFGAEDKKQVLDNVQAFVRSTGVTMVEDVFKNVPENILNPVLWPK